MPRHPLRWVALAAAALLIVVLAAGARPWLVHGGSMSPQVPDGSIVVVDGLSTDVVGYHRGDIVVLSTPAAASDVHNPYLLKRIVGVPGDHVRLTGGRVFVNGAPLLEPYLTASEAGAIPLDEGRDVVVPPGEVFVLGDNRGFSRDSKSFGPVPLSSLHGRVWLILGPGYLAAPTGVPAAEAAGTNH